MLSFSVQYRAHGQLPPATVPSTTHYNIPLTSIVDAFVDIIDVRYHTIITITLKAIFPPR